MVFKLLLRGLPWVGKDAWRNTLLTSKVLFCLGVWFFSYQIRWLYYRTLLPLDFLFHRHGPHALEDHLLLVGVVTRS